MQVVRAIRTGAKAHATIAKYPRSHFSSTTNGGGGSSFFQRLTSFFAGVGVACSACGFLIQTELSDSNIRFDKALRSLESRISAIESKSQ